MTLRAILAGIIGLCVVASHPLWMADQVRAATLLPPPELCFTATTPTSGGTGGTGTGFVGLLGTITGGTGGTAGTYGGVPLTGGAGLGATANITVAGGAVTAVAVLNPGVGYQVGDVLSAAAGNIGGTSGFSVPVASVAINSALAGGKAFFYQPGTLIFKQTWSNAGQTVLNTNPVTLDQNGCAIVYGTGSYRVILQDSLGNTVFDQVTTDTSASNSVFWAGLAGGTPNAITITDPGFNATDGVVINFTALSTNTGATTLNPSGFGAIPILKDTTAGPVSLIGSEIVANNPISTIYRATDNAFHLLNTVIASASGATAPLCGAVGLKVQTTSNNNIAVTATQVVMQSPSGTVINRSNVSANINITLGTSPPSVINGMDGEAAGTSAWLYVWLIDNGAAPAGLASAATGNGLAPTMPSGYTYKCRMGAVRVDGSTNLLRTLQLGSWSQYTLVSATNTANYVSIASGNNANTMTAASVSSVVPPTANMISVTASAVASSNVSIGPNANNAAAIGNANFMHIGVAAGFNTQTPATMVLESTNIYYAGDNASNGVLAIGWKDAVNAN